MCNHCGSARKVNGTVGIQQKTVGFAESLDDPSAKNARSQRSEKSIADGSCCDRWKKTCCGGGCCDSALPNSPCCGIRQPAGTVRQSQPSPYRTLIYQPDNVGGISGYPQFGQPAGRLDYNCNTGYATGGMAASCGIGEPIIKIGVCPAMMRNLPCTPIIEPKCFGGDCRDDDTDSENSRQI